MKTYKNEFTKEIAFPLGGIGTGSLGLDGSGHFVDWEIFNKPAIGSFNGYSHLAVRAEKGERVIDARVLQGDYLKNYPGHGDGMEKPTMAGFPHFNGWAFNDKFPMAELEFSDPAFPGKVTLEAFNPMIPMDDFDSSLPAAFFAVTFENTQEETLTYSLAFSVKNPFNKAVDRVKREQWTTAVILDCDLEKEDPAYGNLTMMTDGTETSVQPYWYRGAWQDGITMFWREFSTAVKLSERQYAEGYYAGDTATLMSSVTLAPGEKKSVRMVLAWYVPNCRRYWGANWSMVPDEETKKAIEKETWKNYYATQFASSAAVADYAMAHFEDLYARTSRFRDALNRSTLPEPALSAAIDSLSVLKSNTVLRLEDGSIYGWEGTWPWGGSCEGTCQHVWNYAYALCYLFPNLERSIRELEFKYCTFEDGKMDFRLMLPLGHQELWRAPACVDGQMGAIIKTYREWMISGDNAWMSEKYDTLKKIIDYARSDKNPDAWDRDGDGVLEGRQHNTLDTELFGPSSWLEGFYLLALKAMAKMAEFLGKTEDQNKYTALFENGKAWTDKNLFNGEYYFHKVDLKDRELAEKFNAVKQSFNEETGELKYQIGEGSEIDQLLGQWHADLIRLGDVFDQKQRKTALKSIMKYNFKPSMRAFANPWRLYSVNDEAGTVMCEYPENVYKPMIPISYCEETMHGFEYALAGLLMAEGMTDEALKVIAAVRDKYDGFKRNPFDELECGHHYARSMAAFAFLPIYAGWIVDLPHQRIGFDPLDKSKPCSGFFAAGNAWGEVTVNENKCELNLAEGTLTLCAFLTERRPKHLYINGREVGFTPFCGLISFGPFQVSQLVVEW